MKKTMLALLLLGSLLFISGCKPDDECQCTRQVNGETRHEIRPLDTFSSCQELADDLADKLGKDVECF